MNDFEIEKSLRWPENTIKALHTAFKKHMGRHDEWNFSSEFSPQTFETAQRYYMRGKFLKSSGNSIHLSEFHEEFNSEFEDLLQNSFVVCDSNVLKAWSSFLEKHVDYIFNNPTEDKKSLEYVANLIEFADMNLPWLIIGGGITSDLAAFAAHLVGVKFILAPTTLLAMVDASLGGKTGVNFTPHGKNLVGAFAFPEKVLVYKNFLKTLPEREVYSGGSECLKHALIKRDNFLFENLCVAFEHYDLEKIYNHLPKLLDVKAQIVQRDPFEKGERAVLNLGHTLAHALEAFAIELGVDLSHGEAVAVGLAFELFLAQKMGFFSNFESVFSSLQRSKCLLSKSELEKKMSVSLESVAEKICNYMLIDKKKRDENSVPFVFVSEAGYLIKNLSRSLCLDYFITFLREEYRPSAYNS